MKNINQKRNPNLIRLMLSMSLHSRRSKSVILFPLVLVCVANASYSGKAPLKKIHELTQSIEHGGSIRYLRDGSGEPVVLVHGFGETAEMWRPVMPELSKSFTVIAPNLPGLNGSSFMSTGQYDMKTVAKNLHEFVKRLGFKKIKLVGHDIGLMAVYAYASQYPDEVSNLVLMDAPIPGIGKEWDVVFNNPALWHFHYVNSPIALKLVKGRERTFLDHFWISFSGNPDHIAMSEASRRAYTIVYSKPGAMAAALGYFKSFPKDAEDNKVFATKGKLQMPVLTIEGERSMGGLLSAQAKQAAKNVKSVLLKGAGHWITEERPLEVKSALFKFLTNKEMNQ